MPTTKENMKTLMTITTLAALALTAQADDHRRAEKREHHNYILERQEAYMVQGPPTDRLIIGKREIDGYNQHNGTTIWFEGNHVVGVTR
jgi:hypothetical protein